MKLHAVGVHFPRVTMPREVCTSSFAALSYLHNHRTGLNRYCDESLLEISAGS